MMIKRSQRIIGVVAVLLVAVEWSPWHEPHGAHWWHQFAGFELGYGFLGCVVIVIVSKTFGSAVLQRGEKYYEDEP